MSTYNITVYRKQAELYRDDKITEATEETAVKAWRWLSTEDSSTYMELMTPTVQNEILTRALKEAASDKEDNDDAASDKEENDVAEVFGSSKRWRKKLRRTPIGFRVSDRARKPGIPPVWRG